jgi:hypothetical protein
VPARLGHEIDLVSAPNANAAATSAYYSESVSAFVTADPDAVLGALARASGLTVEGTQIDAWRRQITLLQTAVAGIDGSVFLEFDIPRLGSRIDGVLVTGSAIVPIEFKVGEHRYAIADYNQAWDYALDLKNFHAGSNGAPVFPVLCATEAVEAERTWKTPHADGVYPPLKTNSAMVREAIGSALLLANHAELVGAIVPSEWGRAAYRPSPTIIEAARALYARHSVEQIARSDAGARNLKATAVCIDAVIAAAREQRHKAIVFVTGVPGAGKTLAGLNVATQHREDDDTHAVFLSGNGPLVAVLREALVLDVLGRQRASGATVERKGVVRQRVKPFIQNVHHFRDEAVRDKVNPPAEHVAIFDEAQRAWNREKTSQFMQKRKNVSGFTQSEPEFLLSYMDRHRDWAVVVCLVGGGQEIHDGEAGISAWLDALREQFADWRVYLSPELRDTEYAAGQALEALGTHGHVATDVSLHLEVSLRSFRSEQVSRFVKALLDSDESTARSLLSTIRERYPIVMTRNRSRAKQWVRNQARGTERYGLVASSQAQRLKAYCIDVRVDVDPVKYFLAPDTDVRSSCYLEDAATEFHTQGLELDWTCVSWDADLRRRSGAWSHHSFRGDKWVNVRKEDKQRYLLNAYRVLLTRARQGMVLFVPPGRKGDHTIAPTFYDETWEYLRGIGVSEV